MSDLESLLRATSLREGRISITCNCAGQWRATICHFTGHMTWAPEGFGDPVEALRVALIEDERAARETERKYAAAPKLGAPAAADDFDVVGVPPHASVPMDDFEGLA